MIQPQFIIIGAAKSGTTTLYQYLCRHPQIFIGADPNINLTEESTLVANKAEDDPEWFIRKQMTSSFNQIPGVEQIKSLLPQSLKDQAYQWVRRFKYKDWKSQQYMPPPMRPETRQMLLEKYREPNQKLAEFLNWDLSSWNC